MKTRVSVITASIVLILAMLACSMPGSQDKSNKQSGLAMTITAQALVIQNSTDKATVKHIFTRVPHTKDTPTPAPASLPSVPMVSVSSPTNCRTGPSTDYDLLYTLDVGQTAEVVGKYSAGNYWIIKIPGGVGTCWLWGEYATIIGNVDSLPEMIPPPAPPTAVPTDTPEPSVIKTKPKHPTVVPTVDLSKYIHLFLPTSTPTPNWPLFHSVATYFFKP